MKAKLVKNTFDGWFNYYLKDNNDNTIGATKISLDMDIFASSKNILIQKLSDDNCNLIEYGFDLDEMSKIDFEQELGDGPTANSDINSMLLKAYVNGSRFGFQKALESLGDKKFTEDNLRQVYMYGANNIDCYGKPTIEQEKDLKNTIQSLQQKEWEVEIEMEENCPYDYTSRCTQGRCHCKKPKLDKNGCLILKRI